MESNKRCIINVAIGEGWYPAGQQRLLDSLKSVNNQSEYYFIKKNKSTYGNPYADKVMAIYEAMNLGFTQLLYLDCSITALRDTHDIWQHIEDKGYYLYNSGYNCAQTATDHCLKTFKIKRDEAEKMPEAATNVIGFNLDFHILKKFIQQMADSVSNGAINGIKWPNEDQRRGMSKDERFLFCRQDQTVISLLAGIYKLELDNVNNFVYRHEYDNIPNESVIFKLKGGDY